MNYTYCGGRVLCQDTDATETPEGPQTRPQMSDQSSSNSSSCSSGARAKNSNSNRKSNGNARRNFRRTQGPQINVKKASRKKATANNGEEEEEEEDGDDDDEDRCLICTDKLQYVALTPCHHKTCHKCSFRQIALYGKKACLICRTENDGMIFSESVQKEFDDFENFAGFIKNDKYGINFTSNKVADITLDLLQFHCSLCEDKSDRNIDHGSFKKYNDHLKSSHNNKTICMICATHKHAFSSELPVYTTNQLKNHLSRGDTEGFKGHPMCAFCSGKRFYSDDELYLHMREKHEKCHICDKIDPKSPQYFKDYNQLFDHFKSSHYACTVLSCLDAKFVVFRDELELQAHILQEHGDIIGGKPKFFQSELSTFMSTPARVIRENNTYNGESLMSNNINNSNNNNNNNNLDSETPEMKRLRLEERAKHYLNNSDNDYNTFLSFNKDYDRGKIRVTDLFNAYKTLFTSPEANIYLLLHNLSETYPRNSQKFKELDTIYSSHEQQQQRQVDLPSLSDDPFMSMKRGIWGNSGSNKNNASSGSAHSSRTDLKSLPRLQSPSPNHDPFHSPYQVKTAKTVRKPVIRTAQVSSTPKQPVSFSKSLTSTPRTNTPTSHSVSFTQSYLQSKKSNSSTSLNSSNSTSKLANLNLPSLPTPKPKVYIPPVHERVLPDPKKWGKNNEQSNQNTNNIDDDMSNLMIQRGGNNNRKKGKQNKQLLFHIGV